MSDKRTIPENRLLEFRQMYERGDRLADIADAFRVTPKTLRDLVAAQGLPKRVIVRGKRSTPFLSEADAIELLASYADPDVPVKDILERFAIPVSRLYAELQKAGVARRKHMPSKTSGLGDERRAEIVAAYANGASAKTIAASTGLNYDQVYVVLREAGITLKTDGRPPGHDSPEVCERFRELYADNSVTVAEILARLQITQYDFKRLVKELQLVPRGKGGGNRSIPGTIIAMMPEYARRHEAGESMSKLAGEAGIGLATIKVRLRKLRQRSID